MPSKKQEEKLRTGTTVPEITLGTWPSVNVEDLESESSQSSFNEKSENEDENQEDI